MSSVPESSRLAVELRPHPASAGARALRDVAVQLTWQPVPARLALRYRLGGNPDELLLPAAASPRRADGLWRHTCFEAFVRPAGGTAYAEFNLSPSGEWAAYGFDDRRRGMRPLTLPAAPAIRCRLDRSGLELTADLALGGLATGVELWVGLAAVIELRDAGLSWWALAHPGDRPDFHDPAGFTLCLAPAEAGPRTEKAS